MLNKQKINIKNGNLTNGKKNLKIKNIKILGLYSNEGANATVFKAYDTVLEREVALKIWCRIDRDLTKRTKKAQKECAKISSLKHPNIVTIHSADIIQGYPFVITEFLQGITLWEWIKKPRSFHERLRIWLAISDALEYCHKSDVIHGDLHLKNIMINDKGAILFDFGTSIFSKSVADSYKRASSLLLKLGDILFPELPLSKLVRKDSVMNPEIIRRGIDNINNILGEKERIKVSHRQLKFIDFHLITGSIALYATLNPIFIFEKLELLFKKLPFIKLSFKKPLLESFYNQIYSYSKTGLKNAISGVDDQTTTIETGIVRKKARELYIEWSDYYTKILAKGNIKIKEF